MTPMIGIMASAAMGSKQSSYESIATVTVTSTAASITFSSIPSTYKHLQIRGIGRTDYAAKTGSANVRFNADGSAIYTRHYLYGDGTSAVSGGQINQSEIDIIATSGSTAAANIFGAILIDIIDYADTTKYKTLRHINGVNFNDVSIDQSMWMASGLWRSTAAITSIVLDSYSTSNFVAGSTFALYGIKG